jgi:hypothetical protein
MYGSAQDQLIRGLSIHYGLIPAALGFVASIEGLRALGRRPSAAWPRLGAALLSVLILVGLYRFTFYLPAEETLVFRERKSELEALRPICVQSCLFPHLTPSGKISIFPECSEDAEYLMLQLNGDLYPLSRGEYQKQITDLFTREDWRLADDWGGTVLFQRVPRAQGGPQEPAIS